MSTYQASNEEQRSGYIKTYTKYNPYPFGLGAYEEVTVRRATVLAEDGPTGYIIKVDGHVYPDTGYRSIRRTSFIPEI